MNQYQLIAEFERMYQQFISVGNFEKAQDALMKIAELKSQQESVDGPTQQNILLG